jgi:peptidyl-prolyl cis-trans isomerase SurA
MRDKPLVRPAVAAVAAFVFGAASAQAPRTPPPAPDASAAAPAQAGRTRTLDRIVAVVNDEVITESELNMRTAFALQQLARQRIAPPPRELLQRQVLERMIVDRAQIQFARETGVRVDDATVNAAIGRLAEQSGLSLPQFRARLEADGIAFARFREDVRDDIIMTRLREREVDRRVVVSEGEVDNFLAERAGVAADATEYNIAQILLRVPDGASTDRIEELRKRADELVARIKGGADFAALAASHSASAEALAGGELGWRTAERLPSLFLDAVRGLKPGEVAPVVRSPGGFHILKLLGSRNAVEAKVAGPPLQQTRVRHILLRVTDLTPEPEVRRRLAELRLRIVTGGQDFGQMARLHSVDGSATRGGELGWIYPGDTVPEFERAMNALQPGDVSEPVQTPFGWHLIQVLERRTEESPIERRRLEARQVLRERKIEEQYQEWLRQLRDRTYVELRLDDA